MLQKKNKKTTKKNLSQGGRMGSGREREERGVRSVNFFGNDRGDKQSRTEPRRSITSQPRLVEAPHCWTLCFTHTGSRT